MTDDDVGKILRELGSLRGEIHEMRTQSDSRHRTIANEMGELRAMTMRALDVASDAKRIADASANDTQKMQRAVVDHTRGLASRVEGLERDVADTKAETLQQSVSLNTLVRAENARLTRETILDELAAERWKWAERCVKFGIPSLAAAGAAIGWILTHWKP